MSGCGFHEICGKMAEPFSTELKMAMSKYFACDADVCVKGLHFCEKDYHGIPICKRCLEFMERCFTTFHEQNCSHVCREQDCGPLPTPLYGQHNGSDASNEYGSTISYICNKGYRMVGQSTIVCTDLGKWSEFPPSCHGEDANNNIYFAVIIVLAIICTCLIAVSITMRRRLKRIKDMSIEPDLKRSFSTNDSERQSLRVGDGEAELQHSADAYEPDNSDPHLDRISEHSSVRNDHGDPEQTTRLMFNPQISQQPQRRDQLERTNINDDRTVRYTSETKAIHHGADLRPTTDGKTREERVEIVTNNCVQETEKGAATDYHIEPRPADLIENGHIPLLSQSYNQQECHAGGTKISAGDRVFDRQDF